MSINANFSTNSIAAWKGCYLLHKVLREGHKLVPQHSMRQRQMLIELGKLWGHLNGNKPPISTHDEFE